MDQVVHRVFSRWLNEEELQLLKEFVDGRFLIKLPPDIELRNTPGVVEIRMPGVLLCVRPKDTIDGLLVALTAPERLREAHEKYSHRSCINIGLDQPPYGLRTERRETLQEH